MGASWKTQKGGKKSSCVHTVCTDNLSSGNRKKHLWKRGWAFLGIISSFRLFYVAHSGYETSASVWWSGWMLLVRQKKFKAFLAARKWALELTPELVVGLKVLHLRGTAVLSHSWSREMHVHECLWQSVNMACSFLPYTSLTAMATATRKSLLIASEPALLMKGLHYESSTKKWRVFCSHAT